MTASIKTTSPVKIVDSVSSITSLFNDLSVDDSDLEDDLALKSLYSHNDIPKTDIQDLIDKDNNNSKFYSGPVIIRAEQAIDGLNDDADDAISAMQESRKFINERNAASRAASKEKRK
jgi:hypothetical protein